MNVVYKIIKIKTNYDVLNKEKEPNADHEKEILSLI